MGRAVLREAQFDAENRGSEHPASGDSFGQEIGQEATPSAGVGIAAKDDGSAGIPREGGVQAVERPDPAPDLGDAPWVDPFKAWLSVRYACRRQVSDHMSRTRRIGRWLGDALDGPDPRTALEAAEGFLALPSEAGRVKHRQALGLHLDFRSGKVAEPAARRVFKFVDLFAGIGAFRKAFEAAGGTCVATAEWNKYARQTYAANFGGPDGKLGHPFYGDITKVDERKVPDHDVLLAGFPCQPFSIAGVVSRNHLGRAHGFACDTQGTLFFDVVRIIAAKRPAAFVLENVKNLVGHDGGNTFRVIIDTLKRELGYHDVTWRVIDAKGWVPQHRERTIIVGFRDPCGFDLAALDLPDPSRGPRLASILHREDGSEEIEERFLDAQGKVLPRYTLTDGTWASLRRHAAKHAEKGNGFGHKVVGPEDVANTLSARYHKDGAEILIRREGGNPRKLTPREAARLFGFDEPGKRFAIPVSDVQAWKQFGNSIVVPMMTEVAKAVAPHVLKAPR